WMEAGEALAAYATTNWEGKVDWVIGLDLPEAGQLVQSRITGAFEGVRAGHPDLPVEVFVRIDGRGMRDRSKKLVSDFLQRHPRKKNFWLLPLMTWGDWAAMDAVRARRREMQFAIGERD